MLKPYQARDIREQYLLQSVTITELAARYGVTYSAIWHIIRGKTHTGDGGPIIRDAKHRDLLQLAAEYIQIRGMQTYNILQHLRRNIPLAEQMPTGDLLRDILDVKYAIFNQTTKEQKETDHEENH